MEKEIQALRESIRLRLREKGNHSLASSHEILGMITEEYHELIEAIKKNSHKAVLVNELLDLAVAAVFGATCIAEERTHW